MKKHVKRVLRYLLFFGAGLTIFWLIYKDLDVKLIKSVLTNDVNYFWVWISLVVGVFSHISRAIRWNYLIEPMGIKPKLSNTFMAVMFGYLMNLVVPRMGEISRCGVLARYEKVSFMKLVGTVVTERIIDISILLLFAMVAILSQFGQITQIIRNNPGMGEKIVSMVKSPLIIGSLTIIVLLIILFRRKIAASPWFKKAGNFIFHLKEGLVSIRYVRKKKAFIFYSFLIWFLYYLMLYCSFFAFDYTARLSPLAALTTFVMGSFGMAAPVQGGLGTWHFMTKESLILYGISNEEGIIFAVVAHAVMTLLIIVLGLASMLLMPFVNRKK